MITHLFLQKNPLVVTYRLRECQIKTIALKGKQYLITF